ncbi:hypothetical protein [Streptomyces alanosinicus]|uniref:MBL fold metallo-hydrolase n=1 Tax=Streptomyces alanosinicus TaxID=68171 RepID=A0A918YJ94_9ACTN|nr:hypothetical protein [Streptomyces alanosinicus]GHE05094.1 hypothetical protein GCM10010339_39460 [Streptomyces alanosinicus]
MTTPRQLAPGIARIATTGRNNAFLVDGDDGFTLVDVGWAKAPSVLLDAVAELGRTPSDIRRIVPRWSWTSSPRAACCPGSPAKAMSPSRRPDPGAER